MIPCQSGHRCGGPASYDISITTQGKTGITIHMCLDAALEIFLTFSRDPSRTLHFTALEGNPPIQ